MRISGSLFCGAAAGCRLKNDAFACRFRFARTARNDNSVGNAVSRSPIQNVDGLLGGLPNVDPLTLQGEWQIGITFTAGPFHPYVFSLVGYCCTQSAITPPAPA